MIAEIEHLTDKYLDWLKNEITFRQRGQTVEVTTPFLDRHNDYIQFYTKLDGNELLLSDRGYTIANLKMSGCKLDTEERLALLKTTLNGFGVSLVDDDLRVRASTGDYARKKHRLLQAILAVNDLFYLTTSSAQNMYHEDVVAWLDHAEIRYISRVELSGKTGYSHHFDFVIPKSDCQPERVLQSINYPDRASAERTVFAWQDTRESRTQGACAYAILNDGASSVPSDVLDAFRNYDVRPVLWSERESVREELAA
ncbi:MAG: DUF1829 domain-containing protein [Chloroflexi bacterium]|nr:DUF1829 domain-containing protein [Chloroflexota bacterium]